MRAVRGHRGAAGRPDMTARQTVVRVRGDETALAAEVASLLPSQMGQARRSIAVTVRRGIRTTFCPICGGNKGKSAARCGDCRDRANREYAAKARAAGHKSAGRRGAARSLVGEAIARDNPDHGDYQPQAPTWSRRVRGEGHAIRQKWDRKVLVNGVWVSESQTPEGVERTKTDDEAVRRLQGRR